MTTLWTGLQTPEKTCITFPVAFTKEVTVFSRIGAMGNFIGNPQMKQATLSYDLTMINYKFQISSLLPLDMLLNNIFTVILARKMECRVILRFTGGEHNRDEGGK